MQLSPDPIVTPADVERGKRALVKDAAWISLPALCLTILITHLGLLLWETRYVSASLAFPALKPPRERS